MKITILLFPYLPSESVEPNDPAVLFGLNEAAFCGRLSSVACGGQEGTQGRSLQQLSCGGIRTSPLQRARED